MFVNEKNENCRKDLWEKTTKLNIFQDNNLRVDLTNYIVIFKGKAITT